MLTLGPGIDDRHAGRLKRRGVAGCHGETMSGRDGGDVSVSGADSLAEDRQCPL